MTTDNNAPADDVVARLRNMIADFGSEQQMTLSDERLREIAAYQPLEFRISGSELISMARELLSRRASPHGEAGEQDAEPEYDRPDHHAIDGSGDVQPFSPTPSVETAGEAFPCQDCGGSTLNWFAPNKLWNRVVGGPDATDDPGGFLCPNCFIRRAEAAGIKPTAWMLDQETLSASPGSSARAEPLDDAGKAALEDELLAMLRDPNAVHQNMLRGTIAKPSVEQIAHLYGDALYAAPPRPHRQRG